MTILSQRRGKWKHRGLDVQIAEAVWRTTKHCGICGRLRGEDKKDFDVDHDHTTGKVRGMLCRGCNWRIDWAVKHKQAILKYLGDQ